MRLFGGIEGGGTKFVCAVADERLNILSETVLPTQSPEQTVEAIAAFFNGQQKQLGPVTAYGVGSFGPLRRDTAGQHFVGIGNTPKAGWKGFALPGALQARLGGPVILDTDVNCALRAELEMGSAQGMQHVVYVTVGTGIGGGICIDGRLINGSAHPEIGHMLVPKLSQDLDFKGVCPFHGDRCVEGLASGPALAARLGHPAQDCGPDDPIWQLQAHYLALMCHNLIQTFSPQRIVLGGGVMNQVGLLEKIQAALRDSLRGYCASERILSGIHELLTVPALNGRAGVLGALMLARDAFSRSTPSKSRALCE
jgi:fructokinase